MTPEQIEDEGKRFGRLLVEKDRIAELLQRTAHELASAETTHFDTLNQFSEICLTIGREMGTLEEIDPKDLPW
jgi:hypothetical protein